MRKYLLILLLFSCDSMIEDKPTKIEQTQFFEVHHSNLDEVDLERLDIWFGEFCRYWESNSICGTMGQPGRTRLVFDKCEAFQTKPGWIGNAYTIYRSEPPGATIFVCNLRKEVMYHEFAHAILMETARSFVGISPAMHEACAHGMVDGFGSKKDTWKAIKD